MIFENSEGLAGDAYDVCVVGAGPVGISLAVELERLGLSVLLLESGARSPSPSIQALSDAELNLNVHDDMRIAVARMLGGTSNLWGARCLKFDPIDFMSRPGVVEDAPWPISYEELFPYYEKACEYTWSGQPVYSLPIPGFHPSDESFRTDTLERWANEQKLQVIHAEALANSKNIDVRLRSTVSDVEFSSAGLAQAVIVTDSETGRQCKVAVKRLVVATGGLESTRLLLALQRKSPERFGGVDGPLGRYYMGHVIGEIADIVLSVDGMDKAFDFFVDEHGSYVRRRFVPNDETQLREKLLNVAMWPVVPPVADPRHGSAILSLVYLALAFGPLGRLVVAEAIRKRHVPDKPEKLFSHVLNLFKGMPSAVVFVADFFRRRYFSKTRLPGFFILNKGHRYGLSYHSEQVPHPESRVTLKSELDRTGLPKLKIDLRFHEQDAVSIVRTHDLFEKWLKQTGMGHLEYRVPNAERVSAVLAQAKHGTHQVGTARMALDSASGVVDRNLRTFDCPNLFVASSAVLPTSGQANPTLTVIALALRLAETLAAEIGHDSAQSGAQSVSTN
jgi:choline dehydrogenase-like flavoprotein